MAAAGRGCRYIAVGLARGLAAAHDRGVLHGDITAERFSSGGALAAELERLQEPLAGRAHSRRRRALLAGVSALLVLGLSAFLLYGRSQRADSLAVLPFSGTGEDTEYLSEGITESLINSVSQIPSLKVIARSSVFNYKGRPVDPRKVGSELGVRTLLLGRVAQRGERITISAELVDTRDGSRIWGAEYNRKAGELSVVPEEIVREISEKLRGKLTGETRKRLTRRYTENTEAYRLYLKGRYHWNRRRRGPGRRRRPTRPSRSTRAWPRPTRPWPSRPSTTTGTSPPRAGSSSAPSS